MSIKRLTWLIITFASYVVAVLVGYGVAYTLTTIISVILFFLWIIGVLVGLIVGNVSSG